MQNAKGSERMNGSFYATAQVCDGLIGPVPHAREEAQGEGGKGAM